MYSLTSNLAPSVHCLCSCTRNYILDEMYYCTKCQKPLCRYCLAEEIDYFYCRMTLSIYQPNEAATFRNKSSKDFCCPVCFNVMSMMLTMASTKQRTFYYNCMFCQYNTIPQGIKSEDTHDLLMKVMLHKGRYQKIPHQLMHERLLDLFRFNQEEANNMEKFVVRTKRKVTQSQYYTPNKARKAQKYLMSDFEKQQEQSKKLYEDDKTLKTFEQIYMGMIEQK